MKMIGIALAIATMTLSGAATAWIPNGTGGAVEFSGTLTPKTAGNPWEVQVGSNINSLDGSLALDEKIVNITLNRAVPLLGIRVSDTSKTFTGTSGIAPQIDYNGAVSIDDFNGGETTLSLNVVKADDAGVNLGKLNATFSAAGVSSSLDNRASSAKNGVLFASAAGHAFYGGVGKTKSAVPATATAGYSLVSSISGEYVAQYTDTSSSVENIEPQSLTFNHPQTTYSAYYGAGLRNGSKVTITLINPAKEDIAWKATFPIVVSYQ